MADPDETPTIGGRTEDRIDLATFDEDLPHSLPGMRPSRFPQVTEQERRAYRRFVVPLRRLRRATFRLLGLRDSSRSATAPVPAVRLARVKAFDWSGYTQHQWGQAVTAFLREMQGSDDIRAAANDWHFSDAALPEEWRLGTRVGIGRATLLTGASEAAVSQPNPRFLQAFADNAFARLSDRGQSRLSIILNGDNMPGGSVRSIIQGAVETGENPLATARMLSDRFDQYENWEWARLTRTEVAFSQEEGIREELRAENYVPIDGYEYAPYHPSCLCSETVDTETGLIMPDVSVTACELCQAALIEGEMLAAQQVPATQGP